MYDYFILFLKYTIMLIKKHNQHIVLIKIIIRII